MESGSSVLSTMTLANFQIIDSLGTHSFTGSGFGPHEVLWYSFDAHSPSFRERRGLWGGEWSQCAV